MKLSSAEMKDGDILKVSIDVENTGKRAGSEVVQLYVSGKNSTVPRAVKELKGFAKVFLNPGEKKTVTMEEILLTTRQRFTTGTLRQVHMRSRSGMPAMRSERLQNLHLLLMCCCRSLWI